MGRPLIDAKTVFSVARERASRATDFLAELVAIESPTTDPASQKPVQDALAARLEAIGMRVRRISGRSTGGHLLAVPVDRRRGRPFQMLVGHSDTVWDHGTLVGMPLTIADGRLSGPGSFDMKAGIVIGITALEILSQLRVRPSVTPVFFINSDEEVGSPESKREVARLARVADRALVLEPALTPAGLLKTARRGGGEIDLEVIGRAAHAGMDPERGASAVHELARLVEDVLALAEPERGLHLNVGVFEGGDRRNIVAGRARAELDVRILHAADAPRIETALSALEARTEGTRLVVSGRVDRMPMEHTPRNRALWRRARAAMEELGLTIGEGTSGGGSDGNITSLYTATLDGLGAVGDGAHASHEHVILESLVERAALLTMLLAGPPLEAEELAAGA